MRGPKHVKWILPHNVRTVNFMAKQGIDESILKPMVITDADVDVIDENADDGKRDFDEYDDSEQEAEDG